MCAYRCLRGSAIYHSFYCVSFIVENIVQTLDYCGVTILVTGSYIPIIYYSFYCYPTYRKMHLTIIAILNILNLSVMATPKYRAPETRPVRAAAYLLGAMFYVSRIPERFWPGAFDYVVGPRRCALLLVRFSSALPRVHRACCAIPFHRLL